MKYEIKGGSLPVVICTLDQGESMVTQAGGMSWHTQGIKVETKGRGGIGKMIGRAFSGESMFQNKYTSQGNQEEIAFASTFPGAILPVEISSTNELIVQKRAFLASQEGVDTGVFFQKKLAAGFFAGEGFIMIKLSGDGLAFLEIDGSVHEHMLGRGEKITVDTGHVAAIDSTCSMNIESAGGMKSMLLGGEGLFNTVVTGPGRVFIQSMPISRLRSTLGLDIPQT